MPNFLNTYDALSSINTKAYIDYDKMASVLKAKFSANEPCTGSCFITPDGSFLNMPDTHHDVLPVLVDAGIITAPEELLDELKNADPFNVDYDAYCEEMLGCDFTEFFESEAVSYIRCNGDPDCCYIDLPKMRPTLGQFRSIERWLDTVIYAEADHDFVELGSVSNYPQSVQSYSCEEYFTEDIINRIKRFYASGRFYETLKVK